MNIMMPSLQHTASTPDFHRSRRCNEGVVVRELMLKTRQKLINNANKRSLHLPYSKGVKTCYILPNMNILGLYSNKKITLTN